MCVSSCLVVRDGKPASTKVEAGADDQVVGRGPGSRYRRFLGLMSQRDMTSVAPYVVL
jgi:hypothetical protein